MPENLNLIKFVTNSSVAVRAPSLKYVKTLADKRFLPFEKFLGFAMGKKGHN